MIKKNHEILLNAITVGIVVCVGVFVTACALFSDQTEKIELVNSANGEKIYLLRTSWGRGDSRMAIGLDEELEGGSRDYPDKFVSITAGDTPIMYKFENGTLHIYGGLFKRPSVDKFKTKIILDGRSPEDCRNYKSLGLKIFPEFMTYIIENYGKGSQEFTDSRIGRMRR
jgi:hypothetical protein